MNYIKISGNNGSVPDQYYYQFELFFFENGEARLTISKGRESELEIITEESKTIPPEKIATLIQQADQLQSQSESGVQVGGPEKRVEINKNTVTKTFYLGGNNSSSFQLYDKCLELYNSNLKKRLEEIL